MEVTALSGGDINIARWALALSQNSEAINKNIDKFHYKKPNK